MPSDLRYLLQTRDGTDCLRIVYYKETDSTNTEALKLARRGYPHGTLIVADRQLRGRGRRGRHWFSPEGKNIYMSLIFRELERLPCPELITLYSSVCVIEALLSNVKSAAAHIWSKWPNDIYWDDKKLGGILTEGGGLKKERFFVIGIGLNVNSTKEELSKNTDHSGTSLLSETDRTLRRDRLILDIASGILGKSELLGSPLSLKKRWTELSRTPGATVKVIGERESFRAVALGIDERGHLIVRTEEDGKLKTLCAEEVVHLR